MNLNVENAPNRLGRTPQLPTGKRQKALSGQSKASNRPSEFFGYVEVCLFAILFIVIFSAVARADDGSASSLGVSPRIPTRVEASKFDR